MSILSKAADFFGLSDNEDFEYEVEAVAPQPTVAATVERSQSKKKAKVSENYQYQQTAVAEQPQVQQEEKKVVPIHQPSRSQNPGKRPVTRPHNDGGQATGKITILEPRNYGEIQTIAKHLLNGEAVLINFARVDEEQARRIVDFLTGTVYAQDGDIKRVGDEIFLCTPKDMEIEGAASVYGEADVFEI